MANVVYEVNEWLFTESAELRALLLPAGAPAYPVRGGMETDEAYRLRESEYYNENHVFFPVQVFPQEYEQYVRYNFTRSTGFHWSQHTITLNYGIYSQDVVRLHDIEEVITAMVRADGAAARLQAWHDRRGLRWLFHDIRFVTATDLPPPDTEAGDFGRIVTVAFDYAQCDYIY